MNSIYHSYRDVKCFIAFLRAGLYPPISTIDILTDPIDWREMAAEDEVSPVCYR